MHPPQSPTGSAAHGAGVAAAQGAGDPSWLLARAASCPDNALLAAASPWPPNDGASSSLELDDGARDAETRGAGAAAMLPSPLRTDRDGGAGAAQSRGGSPVPCDGASPPRRSSPQSRQATERVLFADCRPDCTPALTRVGPGDGEEVAARPSSYGHHGGDVVMHQHPPQLQLHGLHDSVSSLQSPPHGMCLAAAACSDGADGGAGVSTSPPCASPHTAPAGDGAPPPAAATAAPADVDALNAMLKTMCRLGSGPPDPRGAERLVARACTGPAGVSPNGATLRYLGEIWLKHEQLS